MALLLLLGGFLGCGRPATDPCTSEPIHGTCVAVDLSAPPAGFTLDASRWSHAIEESARWWGASPDTLRGWQIVVSGEAVDCGGDAAMGCTDAPTITLYLLTDEQCPEWFLPHEFGHALIGDPEHRDPRFKDAYQAIADLPGCAP